MKYRSLARRRRARVRQVRAAVRPSRLEQLEDRRLLATVIWDGGGDGARWTDPRNWSGDTLPTAADQVRLPGGSNVTLDQDAAVQSVWVQRGSSLGLYGARLEGDANIDGTLVTRRNAVIDGQVDVGIEGQMLLDAYSSSAFAVPYSGNAHLTVTGDLVNEGTVRLRSLGIDFVHPCCGGARATLVLSDGRFVNDGQLRVDYPSHGLRLDDISFEIDGPVVNRGEVDLDFHLRASGDSWTSSGTIDVGSYQRGDQGLFPAVLNLNSGQLEYAGGQLTGDGRIDLTKATLVASSPFSITGDVPELYTSDTHVTGSERVELEAGASWFLHNVTVDTDLHVAGSLAMRGDVALNGQVTNMPDSVIALSAYGRSNEISRQGDAILNVAEGFTNLGEIRLYGAEYVNVHPVNVGDEVRIVVASGTLVNEGTVWAVEPGSDQHLDFRYEIVGNWTNAGTLDLNHDLTTKNGKMMLAGTIDFGTYSDTRGTHNAGLRFDNATAIYQAPALSGTVEVEMLKSTLQLDATLKLDESWALTIDQAVIAGPAPLTIAETGSLLLFQSEIAAPLFVDGRLHARRTSKISGPLEIGLSGLLTLHAFKDDFYFPSPTWGWVDLTVDQGFTNHGEIRIYSNRGFENAGDTAYLRIAAGLLENLGTIATLASAQSSYQPRLGIFGSVHNAGKLLVEEKSLLISEGGLTNEGEVRVGTGYVLSATSADLIQNSGTLDLEGRVEVGSARTVRINAGELRAAGGVITGSLENSGEVVVGGGFQVSQAYRQNDGTTRLENGQLQAGTSVTFVGGSLAGIGSVLGAVNAQGVVIAPGLPTEAGVLEFPNSLTLSPTTQLELELLGTSLEQIDRVIVGGTLVTDGTLSLLPRESFEPDIGSEFVVVTAGTLNGNFADVLGRFVDLSRRLDVVTDDTSVTLVVAESEQTTLAQYARDQWNAGVTALAAALPEWASVLDTHGRSLPVLPDALASLLGVEDRLATWASEHLKTIDPETTVESFTDLRQAFLDAGYTQFCLLGDAQCGGNLVEVPFLATLDGLSAELPYDEATTTLLDGLAPGSTLAGLFQSAGELSWSWKLGVDADAFYLESDAPLSLEVSGSGALSGQADLPGEVFSLVAQDASQASVTFAVGLQAYDPGDRLRVAEFGSLESHTQVTVEGEAEVQMDWLLRAHSLDSNLRFRDTWNITLADGSLEVIAALEPVSGDTFLAGVTSVLSNSLQEFLRPELVASLEELVLPLTGAMVPKSPAVGNDRLDHVSATQALWWDQFLVWLGGLLDMGQGGQGLSSTAGDQLLQANLLRHRAEVTGAGIKIGVLSDGVTSATSDDGNLVALEQALSSGDLPAQRESETQPGPWVDVLRSGNGASGAAMMEIIHDVAPGASLLFWGVESPNLDPVGAQQQFLEGMDALIAQGVNVIVDNYSFRNDTWFQPSWFTERIREVLEIHGVMWITSAGDDRRNHYQHAVQAEPTSVGQLHVFAPDATGDRRYILPVTAEASGVHRLNLQWNDSFYSPQNTLALHRVDYDSSSATIREILSSSSAATTASAELIFELDAGQTAFFAIEVATLAKPDAVPIVEIFGDRRLTLDVISEDAADALIAHKALPDMFVVGAVDLDTPGQVADYSNAGGSTVRGEAEVLPTLDVLGAAGVSVSGAGGFDRRFYGTGPAAAHVAGVAGLLMELLARDGRPNTQWRALVANALRSTASTFSGADYTQQEGHGLVNALQAASQLGLLPPDDGTLPTLPPAVPQALAFGRLGVGVAVAEDQALRAFLSGDAAQLNDSQLVAASFTLPEGAVLPLTAEFSFDLARDLLGELEQFDLGGRVRGTLLPEAMLQFGIDTLGAYVDPTTYVGGRVIVEPAAKGRLFSTTVELVGNVQARPSVTFDPAAPRLRPGSALDHLLNDTRFRMQRVSEESAATISGTVNADLVLGFFDHVDVDPRLPNTDNGGDPFRVSGSAAMTAELTDFSPEAIQSLQFEWGTLELRNPDVDGDGVKDYTPGVFLANALQFGYSLIEGLSLADYLSGLADGFGSTLAAIPKVRPRPRGALAGEIVLTEDAQRAQAALRQRIDDGATGADDPGIVETIRDWLQGTGDAALSVVQRLQQLDPESPDFLADVPFGQWQTRLKEALVNWQRLRTTVDAIWGGIQKLPSELNQQLEQLEGVIPRAVRAAIRRAHDDAITLFHAGAPPRDGGEGYLERAYDAFEWATAADFLNLTSSHPDLSPRYVLEHFPIRVVIVESETGLRALTEDGLLGADEDAQLRVMAGIQVKKPGVPITEDPAATDYRSKFSEPVFETGEVVVRVGGLDNNNQIAGPPAMDNSTLDQLLELVGLPGIDLFDSRSQDGGVQLVTDATGIARTTVKLGDGDTQAQVEFTAGIRELPLAEGRSNIVFGRPRLELRAGLGGVASISDTPPIVGPGQSALIEAQLFRGLGPLPDRAVTFYMLDNVGSLSATANDTLVRTAHRTSPEGLAYTEYFPPEDALTVAGIGAVYFDLGRVYTAALTLQLVTDDTQYATVAPHITPAIGGEAGSADAQAVRAEREQLIRESEGELDPQALEGLLPLLDAWYDGAIGDAMQVAEGANLAFQASYENGASFETLYAHYTAAERATIGAGTELMEWLVNIQMLGLTVAADLAARRADAAQQYGLLLQQAIERNLTFFAVLQAAIPAQSPGADELLGIQPFVEALRWTTAVDLISPLADELVSLDAQGRQVPWTRETVFEEAGLAVVWDEGPDLQGDVENGTVSGQPRLVIIPPGQLQEDPLTVWMKKDMRAPLEVRLESPGPTVFEQHSFAIGSTAALNSAQNAVQATPAPLNFSTIARAGGSADRVQVDVSVWFRDFQLQQISKLLVPPPELQITARSQVPSGATSFAGPITVEGEGVELRVDVLRGHGVVPGAEVRFGLVGGGSLAQTSLLTNAAGMAEVVFTPPTVSTAPEPGQQYGTALVTVHYLEQGQTHTDSIEIRYRKQVAGAEPEGAGSSLNTPDQYLASQLIGSILDAHTSVDPETGLAQPDMNAVRSEARSVLSQWWGSVGDYDSLGQNALVGSVLYWLERLPHLPLDLEWETRDQAFVQGLTDALANWGGWFAAADALGIEPASVPGFKALDAQQRIAAALNAGITRVEQRCIARANEYRAAPDGTLAEQEWKQHLLSRLVDEGLEVFNYYRTGSILEVFGDEPDTLEEILAALCFTPEISADVNETFLDLGNSVSRARLQLRAGIRVDGVDELLWVDRLPVIIRPLNGASVERGIGVTDADGYYRDWVQLGPESGEADIHVTLAWGDITFSEQVLHLESVPQLSMRVARESDGPAALSSTPPTLIDGERLLVEVQLQRGSSPLPGRAVFSSVFGSAGDTNLFDVTEADGRVRFFATPLKDKSGTLQIAITFREKGELYTKSISVPYQSTKEGASLASAYSAAQVEASSRAGQALGQSLINAELLGQDPIIDYDALEAAQRYWLEAGLSDPDEPLGLQRRLNDATLDTLEDVLTEYSRWQADNQLYAVDDRFPIGELETQLTDIYRAAVDALLELIWNPDPDSSNEAPSAAGTRRLLQIASQVELMGLDRYPQQINDESYSFHALLQRLGYELRIDNIQLEGPAENSLLTVDANYYLYQSDPGPGGSGGEKVMATTTDQVPVVIDVVPFNGILREQDGELRRVAPGGHYTNGVELAPGASELVLDVLATDPAYTTIFDWQRQVRLSGEYRLNAQGRKTSEGEDAFRREIVISSHPQSPEQAVIRAEVLKGRGLLEGQQVSAELRAPAKGQLTRDGERGDRFIYTPPAGADNVPPGQEGSQVIRLTTVIDGQQQTTDITVTYRHVMAGRAEQDDPDSLWGWLTTQFDALTTPLAAQGPGAAGVGSSFGLEDIQFPSLGGSFNRAAGYAGGLLDWSLEAFDVLDTVDLNELLDFLQNGPPTETHDLIRFSLDLSAISAILSPTLLAADFTDLLPEGFSGQVAVDRPELTGQIVFGVDTSADPFYILTRPDGWGAEVSQAFVATDMGARFGVFAQVESDAQLLDGLLGIDHAEGHLTTRVHVDWSRVAAGDGKLRLSNLAELSNLRVGFDGNPLDSFQMTIGGHAQIAGLSEGTPDPDGDPPRDPLLSLQMAGAIYKASRDTLNSGQQLPEGGDLPVVFELRTGSLDLTPEPQVMETLRTGFIHDANGQEIDDIHEFLGDYRQLLVGGPGDLGTPLQRTEVRPLALRDASDWFRFQTNVRGTATSYVQVDFARERGDLDLELFRESTDPITGATVLVPVRGDALAFGDRARVSLLGQPAGTYFVRVSDDAGGRSPYYSLTVQPPLPIDSGITASINGFELRETGLAMSVDTDLNFDARLEGRLLVPFSLQDGVPTEIGFQAEVNNAGLHAEVFTEIGMDAVLTRREAVPSTGAITVDIDQDRGGMVIFDYQSVDRFKFAGLEISNEHGKRWVIGQYEVVEGTDGDDGDGSREPRWTVLATAAAEELFGAPATVTMRVEWTGGQVKVGRFLPAANSSNSFDQQTTYQFPTSFSGGLAGLGAPGLASWFANYQVWAAGPTAGSFTRILEDPLSTTPQAPWQVQRGVWLPGDNGLEGKPTEIRLGQWLLVARARLAAELDVRFNPTNILAAPTSITAGIGVSDLDALVYEVDDGGTPLYPDDPTSPQGLVAVQGGFGTLSTAGLALGAERFSAGIKDVIFIEIYDGKLDLADGPYLLEAGGVGVTIPFFGDEPFDIQDSNPDDGIPLFGLEKPEVDAGQIIKAAAFFFGQAVAFDVPVGQAYDQFSLRDLLPLTIENVHLEFPDTNQLDSFTLAVDAQLNLYEKDANGNVILENGQPKRRGIFAALPFEPILAIGRPEPSGCSAGTAINWPELDSSEYPDIQGLTLCENGFVSVEVEAESLLSPTRQLTFKELGPIFIGAREFPVLGAENLSADGALYLGRIVDGQWDGNVAATFTLKDTTPNSDNSLRASAFGQLTVSEGFDGTPYTDTRLELDWVLEASAETGWLGVSDGYANFSTVLRNRATEDAPFDLSFSSSIGSFDTGLIEIPLGDYFTLFGRARINANAGPDEPYFILRQAGVTVNDLAPDTLKGLTFEAGGFGISADFGRYFVMAAEPEDDPSTPDYDETIGAYFRVAIDEEAGLPGGNIFGLPEWFPIQVTEVGIRFKGSGDEAGEDFDVTLDQIGSNPLQPFVELTDPSNYNLIISGGLESSDTWPIRAQIKNLEIVIGQLRTFVEQSCYTQPALWGSAACPLPFDVASVNGVSIGMEPFELGPVSIGGGLSLGVQDVVLDNGENRQVLYAQILGELSVADVGVGAELVVTQYGPVLARLKSAVPVPIGGIVGAAVGSAFFGVGAAAGFQIGNQTGFVITGLEGALVFDAPSIDEIPNPLDILDRPEFARPKNLSPQEIGSAITRIVKQNAAAETPTYTWNNGFRLVGSGILTNTNIYNAIGGRVTIGMNVGYDGTTLEELSQSTAQIFVRGDLEVLGQSLAQANIVFDASDPINPTFNVAAGIPGSGGILSLLMPMQARIGGQLDTDGLAAGTAVAARTFLETVLDRGMGYFTQALAAVASRYEDDRQEYIRELDRLRDELARLQTLQTLSGGNAVYNPLINAAQAAIDRYRERPAFFKFLLDLNGNQQFDEGGADVELGTIDETVIDGSYLQDRLLGRNGLPAALPSVTDVVQGTITGDAFLLGVMAAGRLLTDLMQVAPELVEDAPIALTDNEQLNDLIRSLFDAGIEKSGDLAETHFTQLASLVVDPNQPDVAGRTLAGDIAEARTRVEKSTRMSAAIASVIFSTLADASEAATNAFFDTINPSMSIEGYVQPVILGMPVGPPRERVHVRIDKSQVDVELKVRLLEMLTRLSTQGIMPVSPITDVTDVRLHIPFQNLYKDLFLGRPPAIDLSASSPWFAGLGSSLEYYGLELAQVKGYVFPGAVVLEDGTETTGAGYLRDSEQLLETSPNNLEPIEIFVDDQLVDETLRTNWDKIQGGGFLLDGRLTLPRFLTEPVELFTEIRDVLIADLAAIQADCDDALSCVIAHPQETFAFLRNVSNIPAEITALQQVAQLQLFVPDLFTPVVDALGGLPALLGMQPEQLTVAFLDKAQELQETLSSKWINDGYLFGQYGSLTSDQGNPEATTGKLLGVDMGEALVIGRGDRLEIVGDFLGVDTRFFVDLNGSAGEQYQELNGAPGFNLAEPFAAEPYDDTNGNSEWDLGEPFTDWNGNGGWDEDGGDFDGDGQWDAGEIWTDLNGNGLVDAGEPFSDLNKNGVWDAGELWTDLNGNGRVDRFEFVDNNPRNGRWNQPEPWEDLNGDRVYTWQEWVDLNGNGVYDPDPEPFVDLNHDGVRQAISDAILDTPTSNGDENLDGGLPRLAAEVVLGNAPAACQAFDLPNRHTVENAQSQFQSFLAALGLGEVLGIDPNDPEAAPSWLQLREGLDNGACLRAYSPGYSYDTSDPLIMRRGGIEMLADVDIPHFIEDAQFKFDVSLPQAGFIPDFEASARAAAISAGPFLLPATGAEGVNLSLKRQTVENGAAVTTFGLGGTFRILGLQFQLPYSETTLGQSAEAESQPFHFSATQDGIYGRLQLHPPQQNNPLADGSWPIQINGGTFSLLFDTRPGSAGLTLELEDASIKIPGFSLEKAGASIQVDASGALHVTNISGDSNLLGLAGVTFNGGFSILPPVPFGATFLLPRATNVSLEANVQITAVPNIPQFAEAHGSLDFQLAGSQMSGSFAGWGYLFGIPVGSPDPEQHFLSGTLYSTGCLQTQFGELQRTFSLPGASCGIAQAQFQLDLGPDVEVEIVGPNPTLTGPNVMLPEGNQGTTRLKIPVALQSLVPVQDDTSVKVQFQVTDQTAQAGEDYQVITAQPLDLTVNASTSSVTRYIEIDVLSDSIFESFNESFQVNITVEEFLPAGPDDQLLEGATSLTVTIQNDDPPDPNDYPQGLWTPPVSGDLSRAPLAHWTFDAPQPGGLAFTTEGMQLNNGMERTFVQTQGELIATRNGLPHMVQDSGLFWLDDSHATSVKSSGKLPAAWEFTVDAGATVLNYDPRFFRFYSRTSAAQQNWNLSWTLDGATYHTIATEKDVAPQLTYQGWDRYEIALPETFAWNGGQLPNLAMPLSLRLQTPDSTMQLDSVSVLGKRVGALDEFLLELGMFLEDMETRLPHALDITGVGHVQVGIGPGIVSPGGQPEPTIIVDVFDTLPEETIITLDSGNGLGSGSALPVVVNVHGGAHTVDLSNITDFEGVIDIGGDLTGAMYSAGMDRGRIVVRNSSSTPANIQVFGTLGTTSEAPGVSITVGQGLGNLAVNGAWLAGGLRANEVGTATINGDFGADVELKQGFDLFSLAGGDFTPGVFQVGLGFDEGNGSSGQLLVQNGNLRGNLEIHGSVELVAVSSGKMDFSLVADHIQQLVTATHPTTLVGGDLDGNVRAQRINSIQIVGGDLNAGIELTDQDWQDISIEVNEYCYGGTCRGGKINSPGSLHIAGGVQSIVAHDILMGLHVDGGVDEIVVLPRNNGRQGGLRGQFDAGSFGMIRAEGAVIDVDLTVKGEAWQLANRPGIERVELMNSVWENLAFHLPPGVTMGPIVVNGQTLDLSDPDSVPVSKGYRLETFRSGLQQSAFVIPASWQNPRNRLDVSDDGFVSPLDALIVISDLNARGGRPLEQPSLLGAMPSPFYDTSGDGFVSPLDVLIVIDWLNRVEGEGEGDVHADTLPTEFVSNLKVPRNPQRSKTQDVADEETRDAADVQGMPSAAAPVSRTMEPDSRYFELPVGAVSRQSDADDASIRRFFASDEILDDPFWDELLDVLARPR